MNNLDAILDALSGVRRRPTWPFLLGGMAIAAIAALFLDPPSVPPDVAFGDSIAQGLGAGSVGGLLIALPVTAALYLGFVRRRNPDALISHFLIIAATGAVVLAAQSVTESSDARAEYARVREEERARGARTVVYTADSPQDLPPTSDPQKP